MPLVEKSESKTKNTVELFGFCPFSAVLESYNF